MGLQIPKEGEGLTRARGEVREQAWRKGLQLMNKPHCNFIGAPSLGSDGHPHQMPSPSAVCSPCWVKELNTVVRRLLFPPRNNMSTFYLAATSARCSIVFQDPSQWLPFMKSNQCFQLCLSKQLESKKTVLHSLVPSEEQGYGITS